MLFENLKLFYGLTLTLTLTACVSSNSTKTTDIPAPSISDDYVDNNNVRQVVGQQRWITAGSSYFRYVQVNNQEHYITAKNSRSNPYYSNKYSRFEWTNYDHSLWFCLQVFDADSASEANNFKRYPKANASNPSSGGCGTGNNDAPWTSLTLLIKK